MGAYLCQIVDVSALLYQETGDLLVAVMGCNVEGSETAFGRHIRIVIALK